MKEIDISVLFNSVAKNTYFYNPATGAITSKLTGYMQGSRVGMERRFTFKRADATRWCPTVSIKLSDIKRAATTWTVVSDVAAAKQQTSGFVQAVQNQTPGKGWILGSVTNGVFSFSQNPKLHLTEDTANAEIERLARVTPGKTFVKVQVQAYVTAGGIQWK